VRGPRREPRRVGLLEAAVDMQAMDREAEREMLQEYGPGALL